MKLKKGDYIVTIFLVFFSIFLAIRSNDFGDSIRGDRLVVELNGEIYNSYPLDEDRKIEIKSDNGGINVVEIKDGAAKVISANCNDKVCMRMQAIKDKGQSIVCLPHKLYLRIDGEGKDEIDQVVQ
ncbi:MAG: NusG domain II-containing protein [Tissierellia bacterium]|nr:NusG domain II-containing protein [Tissierellia bacterium]